MPNAPIPPGMNPLEYGTMLLGGDYQRGVNNPFAMRDALQAQQEQQAQEASQAQALLEEVKTTIDQTQESNKLKELALKLKTELDKSRALEEKLQADPEAQALLEQLMQANAQQTAAAATDQSIQPPEALQ